MSSAICDAIYSNQNHCTSQVRPKFTHPDVYNFTNALTYSDVYDLTMSESLQQTIQCLMNKSSRADVCSMINELIETQKSGGTDAAAIQSIVAAFEMTKCDEPEAFTKAHLQVLNLMMYQLLQHVKPEEVQLEWLIPAVHMVLWMMLHPHILDCFCPMNGSPQACAPQEPCADISWSSLGEWYRQRDDSIAWPLETCIQSLYILKRIAPDGKIPKAAVTRALSAPLTALSGPGARTPDYWCIKGLCILTCVYPKLFAPVFLERMCQLMQCVVSNPQLWLTAQYFFINTAIINMLAAILFHGLWQSMDWKTRQVFTCFIEPVIASEAIMRQCASPMFQQAFTLIPVTSYVLSMSPNSALSLMATLHNKKIFPLTAKDSETNQKLKLMQQDICNEIHAMTRYPIYLAQREMQSSLLIYQREDTYPETKWAQASDLTLVCEDKVTKTFLLHRNIVCRESKYFGTSQDAGFKEAESQWIHLKDSDVFAIHMVLMSIYNRNMIFCLTDSDVSESLDNKTFHPDEAYVDVALSLDQFIRVLYMSEFLAVNRLMNQMLFSLCLDKAISLDSVELLMSVAEHFGNTNLMRSCCMFLIHCEHECVPNTRPFELRLEALSTLEHWIVCHDMP